MNVREIGTLLAMVRALCPAQKIDEHTPDAWLFVLDDVPFDDAKQALKTLGKQLRFIAPADIAQEVRRVRNVRAAAYTDYADTLPDADPDRPLDYIRSLRARNYRAASGAPALGPGPMQQVIETHFVRVESAWSRYSVAPPRAIGPARPADREYDQACALLRTLPPTQSQDWLTAARDQLEADGVPLDHHAVAILAADLATRPETQGV